MQKFILKNFITKVIRPSLPVVLRNRSQCFNFTNKVNQKESLELIEAGVFEVLKSAAKCKQDKLGRTATLEELGKFEKLTVRF
jgi:hypothetical protein